MIRVRINVDAKTDAWDNYRLSKHPERLEELIRDEIEDILKLPRMGKTKTNEKQIIKVDVKILDL